MSYLLFHLIFIIPPILLLGVTLPAPLREIGGRRAQLALPLIAIVALTYTTPWDNYLVARNVWWYGAGRVLGTIGYVPIEEYLFFVLQPLLTGLVFYHFYSRLDTPKKTASASSSWGGFITFSAFTALGVISLLLGGPRSLYSGLVLTWSCPLLAGMWLYGGEVLWAHRTVLSYAVGFSTLYLWAVDAIAIRLEIWTISQDATLGLKVGSLPLEEAIFFLVTNLLVGKGILLLLNTPGPVSEAFPQTDMAE
jgi:lycopene cyclase domain-containing protein